MGREARRVPRWIDEAVHDGLELARTGRRDGEALEQFFVDIGGWGMWIDLQRADNRPSLPPSGEILLANPLPVPQGAP
jgi:hypothetical protein